MCVGMIKRKNFTNGSVYALVTESGKKVETTDTFLPYYTKAAKEHNTNKLNSVLRRADTDRKQRWMIGVSCMSGCPVGCKFCATGKMKSWERLSCHEIVDQVNFILKQNPKYKFSEALEHKINYTRMGEPFLNIENVRDAIARVEYSYPGTHHYISTIGIKGSDFSWIKGNITLQLSIHALSDEKRDWLIPYKNKMTLEELGQIRTESNLKTTVNLTLVDESDFDIEVLTKYFDPKYFFIKLSPINKNECSDLHNMGSGVIESINLS